MRPDFRQTPNIGTTDPADEAARTGSSDALFDHDWEEIVIRFDPSRNRFEVETAGGSESKTAEFKMVAASDGKN